MQIGHKVTTAAKRSRNGRHKAAKYDNPVANSKVCPKAGKSKLCFDSAKAAWRYIRFNSDAIRRQHGYAPVRAYYCPACSCWHVTSKPLVETVSKGTKHGKKAPDAKPMSPELRRDVQRQLHRMEHCVEAAFKALALCDMSRVKALCDEARHYYQTSLMAPGFEARKQKLKARMTYCFKTLAKTRREWMRRLCHVEYHPLTVRYHQWYM